MKPFLVVVSFLVFINFGERVVEGNVQFYWYPVPVAFTSTHSGIATSSALLAGRRSPGQSVHFQVQNTEDGTYQFGYNADTPKDKSYREEKRDAFGRVTGSYGYVDPEGTYRITEYIADEQGFRTRSSNRIYLERAEPLQVIGPIPRPFTQLFNF